MPNKKQIIGALQFSYLNAGGPWRAGPSGLGAVVGGGGVEKSLPVESVL
ncbi:hypothetical protein [Methanobacterium petrolearium]|nr:hypothetical protein [Methanobacterium petrolearium]